MRRFLFLSYAFPPVGGAGVQRTVKFVKFIGGQGWEPVVVTPARASVPVLDPTLERDLPPGLLVCRLPSLEPTLPQAGQAGPAAAGTGGLRALAGRLLFPDRHVLWLPTALPGLLSAVRRYRPEVILVSAPPFSSFLLGLMAARLTGLPLVLDFRDEWSGFYAQGFTPHSEGRLWATMVRRLEGLVVRAASRVVSASPDYGRRFRKLYDGPPRKYVWIPNGYDLDDFAPSAPMAMPAGPATIETPLRLAYTGSLLGVTSLRHLWSALALLSPGQRARLLVEVAGRATLDEPADPGLTGLRVRAQGYLPHAAALALMQQAQVLLLTLSPTAGAERVIPGKLFEYLAACRTILALTPRGRAASLVRACSAGVVADPEDPGQVARIIAHWLEAPPAPLTRPPRRFDRRLTAGRLAQVLEEAVDEALPRGRKIHGHR